MGCGVTVLTIYAFVASLVVLVLSSLLVTMDGCDEDSLAETCKDLNVETGGTLTEVHNRILKLDILNQDNGMTGNTGVDCPVCSVTWFTTLEIVALTLLGVLGLANLGRLTRYIVKLCGKHKLKKENAKIQKAGKQGIRYWLSWSWNAALGERWFQYGQTKTIKEILIGMKLF